VFVHGFTGHPERTWTHKKGDSKYRHQCDDCLSLEPPLKRQKTNLLLKSRNAEDSSHDQIYWPRDLLPRTIPTARVLTYGYDTKISHVLSTPRDKSTFYEMAWDFLVDLEAKRQPESSRPILFVAHSLGGILVKEALRRSASCQSHPARPQFRSVFSSTVGIIFFGTPHGGADPRGLLERIAERSIRAAGFSVNEYAIATLLPSSERLRELRDEFSPIVRQQNWAVHSFQEAAGVLYLRGEKVRNILSLLQRLLTVSRLSKMGHPVSTSLKSRRPNILGGTTWILPLYRTR
jgi:hypothetical protein